MEYQSDNRSLRIAFIAGVSVPGPDAVSQQFIQNVAAIAQVNPNWRIVVVAEKPSKEFTTDNIESFYGVSCPFSVVYVSIPHWMRGALRRHYAASKCMFFAMRQNNDLIYTRHPETMLWSLLACQKTVFDTYRININKKKSYAVWRAFCYKRSQFIGLINHSELSRSSFIEAGIHSSRTRVAYNGSIPPIKISDARISELRKKLNLTSHKKIVCYAGRISDESKGSAMLLELARQIPDANFLFVGAGKNKHEDEAFDAKIDMMGLSNVRRTGWVTPSTVSDYLQIADILIIPPTSAGLKKKGNTVLPIKTFQYLQSGKAIIAPDLPDCREVLQHNVNAMLVSPDNTDAAKEAIINLLHNYDLCAALGKRALADGQKYTWRQRAESISIFIRERL